MYSLASTTWDSEEVTVAHKLLVAGELTMGREVKEFEEQFAKYVGTKYAVMFNSGSSANLAIFAALKYVNNSIISEGDRVIVPAVSWSTTYYPVNQLGFILDFVDIDSKTLNIDVKQVESKITSKTKAIFVVNLLGNPANLVELSDLAKKHNLILLEDNCESLGASINGKKAGSFGLMSSHSFFFSHHICTMEGGMVSTDDDSLASIIRSLRAHGWTRDKKSGDLSDKSFDNVVTSLVSAGDPCWEGYKQVGMKKKGNRTVPKRMIVRPKKHLGQHFLKDKAISEDDERRAQDDVQKLTDKFVAEVDKLVAEKEKEVLTV